VREHEEALGLDASQHGEVAYQHWGGTHGDRRVRVVPGAHRGLDRLAAARVRRRGRRAEGRL